jgi:hypothetical protein
MDFNSKSPQKGNKAMSVLAISYPVTEGAKRAIDRYPAISRAFRLPDSILKEIEKEIEEFLSVSDPEAENTN